MSLWVNIKKYNVHVTGVLYGQNRMGGWESEEILAKNVSDITKDIKYQIENPANSKWIYTKKTTPRLTIVKVLNTKNRENFENRKKEEILYKRTMTRIPQTSSEANETSLKSGKKNHQFGILYPTKIAIKNEGKMKTFSDLQ